MQFNNRVRPVWVTNRSLSLVQLYLLRIWHEVEIDYAPIVQVVGSEEVSVLRREEADARVIRSGADHTGMNCDSAL